MSSVECRIRDDRFPHSTLDIRLSTLLRVTHEIYACAVVLSQYGAPLVQLAPFVLFAQRTCARAKSRSTVIVGNRCLSLSASATQNFDAQRLTCRRHKRPYPYVRVSEFQQWSGKNAFSTELSEQNASVKTIGVLLVLLLTFGCSPQKRLADKLRGADRVVVSNVADHLSIALTGDDANKLVAAIGAARRESPMLEAGIGLELQFFRGTQHLANIGIGDLVFAIDKRPYLDTTGTLKALNQKYREEHPPMLHDKNPSKALP